MPTEEDLSTEEDLCFNGRRPLYPQKTFRQKKTFVLTEEDLCDHGRRPLCPQKKTFVPMEEDLSTEEDLCFDGRRPLF